MRRFILTIVLLTVVASLQSFAKSGNNNKFWYDRYIYSTFDARGELDNNSAVYVFPKNDKAFFEIQFDYADNNQTSDFPLTIYLNEVKGDNKFTSAVIGYVYRSKSSVEFKDDSMNIFIFYQGDTYQLTISSNGTMLLELYKDKKYRWAKYFKPTETASLIYSIRYDVLRDKLSNINWGD